MKTPRGGISDSSTNCDNTQEFIEIVKKYDIIYNTHNPDYKNVEVKMKVWSQIAQEIGLSIDASKRKWKNLRDSYTKYLRSFRIGTKTSKKYQYWAHAENMDFLKPFQGPGRNAVALIKPEESEENECDLGLQVLTKATDEDAKLAALNQQQSHEKSTITTTNTTATTNIFNTNGLNTLITTSSTTTTPSLGTLNTPLYATNPLNMSINMPSLPMVQLPPPSQLAPLLTPSTTSMNNNKNNNNNKSINISTSLAMPSTSMPGNFKPSLPIPTASSVGCLFLDPQQLHSITNESFNKKDTNYANIGLLTSTSSSCNNVATTTMRSNPPIVTKIRRVLPSPQSHSSMNMGYTSVPPPVKMRKINNGGTEIDVTSVLQANRDLDANTLFFLSLARTVRALPIKLQSLAKMRCMRIVSDLELELEYQNGSYCQNDDNGIKYGDSSSPPPPQLQDLNGNVQNNHVSEGATEQFIYMMSPSRVENMIDISSDDEMAANTNH